MFEAMCVWWITRREVTPHWAEPSTVEDAWAVS